MKDFVEQSMEITRLRKKAQKRIKKADAFLDSTEVWVYCGELYDQVSRLKEQLIEADAQIAKITETHRVTKRELAIKHYRLQNRETELEELGELKPPRRITQVSYEDRELNILDPEEEET